GSASIGQPEAGSGKCLSIWARRPASPSLPRRPRPSSAALRPDRRCRPSRAAAGSRKVVVAGAGIAGSAVADLDDLVLAGAARGLDRDHVAGMLADQGAGHRRGDRDQPEADVGLEVAHDLVALLFPALLVGQHHGGADPDLAAAVTARPA